MLDINETSCLKKIVEEKDFLEMAKNADILLAPYHGREAGFCKEFVEIVNPRVTVISDSRYRKETSKGDWYADNSRGWKVHDKDGKSIFDGKTLSTYYYGTIFVSFGYNDSDKRFMHIRTS